jgi:major vault protein
MAAGEREQNRDITLPPDTFIYLQNIGKGGLVTVFKGPCVVNQTGQDQPVRFDATQRRYIPCSLEQAVQHFIRANEGDYVVLENPAPNEKCPTENQQQAVELERGNKVVIPGPWSEALWPGQIATVIQGHVLRSNQYLVAIVYNADKAKANWFTKTVAAEGTATGENQSEQTIAEAQQAPKKKGLPALADTGIGSRIVIKGTDVSFFIPCTGVEVLKDENQNYVRDAVTLEQLEFCCLVDENGKKAYPQGPAVVFPAPTQVFEKDNKGRRKFRPIELNTINGIHLKVTADFEGPDIENNPADNRKFKEGEELFVTGKTLSIYYPREELSIIEYGQGNKKHYSTAIPKGEGRYVIYRETGEIKLIRGPKMFLADPRKEIPVRRVLGTDECSLWYPGNQEAIAYNTDLAEAMASSPSGRSGVISEGDYRKAQTRKLRSGAGYENTGIESFGPGDMMAALSAYEPELVGEESAGKTISRGATQVAGNSTRSLTLNTKYDGVPKIEVWPGFAVLAVGSEGSRRVIEGPEVILLDYDEKLGFMNLSTGKPKSTDKLYKTAYLCVQNNQVGDIVSFESKDHVKGTIKISLRVNFEGSTPEDKLKWFGVDNYVKYLTDHVRSIIAGMAKKKTIAEIKSDYVNLVRDSILGEKMEGNDRKGMKFDNGMRVVEVEVLEIKLVDQQISALLDQAQQQVVRSNIELDQSQRELEVSQKKDKIAQERLLSDYETKRLSAKLQTQTINDQMAVFSAQVAADMEKLTSDQQKAISLEEIKTLQAEADLSRNRRAADSTLETERKRLDLKKEEITATTESVVARYSAAKDGLFEILTTLSREEMAVKLAEATNIERFLSGDSIGGSLSNLLSTVPSLKTFFDKAENGTKNRLKSGSPS